MEEDPLLLALTRVMDDARVTDEEREDTRATQAPLQLASEELIQLPYMLSGLGQAQCAQLFATKPYLLHVTCTLHDINYLDEFNEYMPPCSTTSSITA